MPYTESDTRSKLADSREWLERAILAIHKDGGFGKLDSEYLNYAARWIESDKHLSGKYQLRLRMSSSCLLARLNCNVISLTFLCPMPNS